MKEHKKIFLDCSNNMGFYKYITNKKLYIQESLGRIIDDDVWFTSTENLDYKRN